MAYILSLDPNSTDNTNLFAALDIADETIPGWWEAEQFGTRFLSERDFPIYDEDADLFRVSDADYDTFMGSRF